MSDRRELIANIEMFLTEIMNEYNDASLDVRNDSSPLHMFKKKDYAGRSKQFIAVKEKALMIDPGEFDYDEDPEAFVLSQKFDEALAMFNMMCNNQIDFQNYLYKRATGDKGGKKYKEIVAEMNVANTRAQTVIRDLDAAYGSAKSWEMEGPGGDPESSAASYEDL